MKIILFSLLLLLLLSLIIYFNKKEFLSMKDDLDKLKYYDENNNIIDQTKIERDEQIAASLYIEPDDIVLELGGRYGTVSNVINNILNNKKNHVVVEPDSAVIQALTKNKQNYEYYIENSYISNKNKKLSESSYGGTMIDSDEPNNKLTYSDFKNKYPLKFNVIVADCEGCLCEFLDIIGDDINNINKILFEKDQEQICDYTKIKERLISVGFIEIEKKYEVKYNLYRYVYIKSK